MQLKTAKQEQLSASLVLASSMLPAETHFPCKILKSGWCELLKDYLTRNIWSKNAGLENITFKSETKEHTDFNVGVSFSWSQRPCLRLLEIIDFIFYM